MGYNIFNWGRTAVFLQALHLSVCQYVSLSIQQSVSLSVYHSVTLSLSVCLFVWLSVCQHLSLNLSDFLSFHVCLSVGMSVSVCLFVRMSVCFLSVCLFSFCSVCLVCPLSKSPSLSMGTFTVLKVPKREIFDRSDIADFCTVKYLRLGDFEVKIKKI